MWARPDAPIKYDALNMILNIYSDAFYISVFHAHSQAVTITFYSISWNIRPQKCQKMPFLTIMKDGDYV
jgi:hypothetical protein